jgi:Subtilase family.
MSNIEIGSLQDNYFQIGSTGKTEPTDTYFFSLPTMGSARISAEGFSGDINMELRDKEGRLIKSISTSDKNTGILSTDNLGVADYILNVSPVSGNTNYQVSLTPDGKVDPLTGMGVEAGFFTTDQKGEVGFDLLHDGGRYKGEVAIFSLDGMEEFTSDSKEFIKEAAKRSLSDSVLGHIVISESTEGANPEFRGSLGEENYNNEPYKGVKTFTMSPGKAFTVMLVPNGKVQEVFDNPEVGGDKRPLFSLSSSNPNDAWLYGQIADVTGAGQAFSIENQGVDTGSDRDYQDIIFKVTGATGKAVLLKEVIDPTKDWTIFEGGNKLINFLTLTPPKNTAPPELQFDLKSIYTTGETIDFRSRKVAGQSSRELAASIDAIDQGDTDRITNRCTCKCPKPIARENEADQLKALSGVEYAYPQVPVKLNLLYEPNDTLYNKQWNFKNANVPAAWDVINPATSQTVRGRGATIAIVDDGLEYEHPDLANRYSHSLSWDPDIIIDDPNQVSWGAICWARGR